MGVIGEFFTKYPVVRGLVAYATVWPCANIVQQKIQGKKEIDYASAIRYGLVGCTFVCPVYIAWFKTINKLIPGSSFPAITKKLTIEQTMYWPVAITVFFAGMNFYERQTFQHFTAELKEKYWKTHMTGLCFWPFVTPIVSYSNLISDKNRPVVAAMASFVWASFLTYIREHHYISNK